MSQLFLCNVSSKILSLLLSANPTSIYAPETEFDAHLFCIRTHFNLESASLTKALACSLKLFMLCGGYMLKERWALHDVHSFF